jgi:valyl-tRNA synthetase
MRVLAIRFRQALPEVEVFLPLEGLVDKERESARLQKELDGLKQRLECCREEVEQSAIHRQSARRCRGERTSETA